MNKRIKLFLGTLVIASVISNFFLLNFVSGIGGGGGVNENATFTYQGRLTDDLGTPLVGAKAVTFRLWDASTGGTLVWDDTYNVTLNDGYFTVLLGKDADDPILTQDIADIPTLHIEVDVDGELLTPREALTPVPYAVHAWTVAAESIGNAQLKNAAITTSKISPGSVIDIQTVTGTSDITIASATKVFVDEMQVNVSPQTDSTFELIFEAGFAANFYNPTTQDLGRLECGFFADGTMLYDQAQFFVSDGNNDLYSLHFVTDLSQGDHTLEVHCKSNQGGTLGSSMDQNSNTGPKRVFTVKEYKI
ncbi:MAG: hypothetical protein ACE5DX_03120 [Candidatus Dojkabacteria bacterium]